MSITAEIQTLTPTSEIALYTVTAGRSGVPTQRFCNYLNEFNAAIIWQGNTYNPWPLKAEGWDKSTTGALPTPQLTLANLDSYITGLCLSYHNLRGAQVTRQRTLATFLDPENFAGGNPKANPNAHFPDEVYTVNRKVAESFDEVTFELASIWDFRAALIPKRVALARTCLWEYRSADCGYNGPNYFDEDDNPCPQDRDACGKRVKSCRLRFTAGNVRGSFFPMLGRTGRG